jgi:hypothetical protein
MFSVRSTRQSYAGATAQARVMMRGAPNSRGYGPYTWRSIARAGSAVGAIKSAVAHHPRPAFLHVQVSEALERLERVGRCVWIAPPYIALQLLPGLDIRKLRVSQRVVSERAVHNITKWQSSRQKVSERPLRHA